MLEIILPKEATFYLKHEYSQRRTRNPHYSIRAFARDLEVSPSHLSEFLSGKSVFSPETARAVAKRLQLTAEQQEHWCDLLIVKSKSGADRQAARIRIAKREQSPQIKIALDVYRAISDWQHFALLAFYGGNSEFSIAELSRRLGLTPTKVKSAIRRLEKLNLLKKTDNGYLPTEDFSHVGDSIPSAAIRESHRQVLQLATQALEKFDVDKRESQSLFFSIEKEKLPALRDALKRQLLQVVSQFAEDSLSIDRVSVQALTLQLFPIEESK